jgi:DivIVA domain-containing protein
LLRPDFTLRRTRERYDRSQVDALVDRILATAARGVTSSPVTVAELRRAEFRLPPLGASGYSTNEVDEFLADAEQWLPDRPVPGAPPAGPHAAPVFSHLRLREGYDLTEVDEFVERLMATVNGQAVARPVTAREIRKVQFSPVRMREGYEITEVDAFLDKAEDWLRQG